tara:strand:- start:45 stop:443 length:399 start_codon:yes stop_codon:yes gene_type:complete
MNYPYSKNSLSRLETCDQRIQNIFMEASQHMDITIICGHRNEADQNEAFRSGKSQIKWPNGKHNPKPSKAVDAAPYPINWKDRERATLFAGFVLGLAAAGRVDLRWGGDWDRDWQVADNNFDDLWHFELMED